MRRDHVEASYHKGDIIPKNCIFARLAPYRSKNGLFQDGIAAIPPSPATTFRIVRTKPSALPPLSNLANGITSAGLKQACPEGMFISLTPGNPTIWSGVLFVRKGMLRGCRVESPRLTTLTLFLGPYAPAVLRFQISFPDSYPQLPPLVTFSTELFHPLLTPLTTYMYTTDIQDSGTVSASDQERLPPGGFSLRHGFPEWFGRGRRANRRSTGQQSTDSSHGQGTGSNLSTPTSKASPGRQVPAYAQTSKKGVSTYEILEYIRSNFSDEDVLDSIPLSAAGNPGAWHAWRTHRRAAGKVFENDARTETSQNEDGQNPENHSDSPKNMQNPAIRPPSEWDWDGVWEDRVKKGIATSLSEAVLFGGGTPSEDLVSCGLFSVNTSTGVSLTCRKVRFLAMEDNDVASVQENIRRSLGNPT